METKSAGSPVLEIERPSERLLHYYLLRSILWGPLIVGVLPYRLARYRTLRYRFDQEGISMSWGMLFRREIHLTYSRIQDIHLSSGVVERYFGLARIQIQTASGKAGAEMTIEGLLEFEQVRDFLYSKMRGLRKVHQAKVAEASGILEGGSEDASPDDLVAALNEVSFALSELRGLLGRGLADREGGGEDV
ncbi:MAG: PH domain-containing protein [Acidimicrobiia bacterium]|nr:PH domain-containing protein [Acidimicrobiia bacterium]